jgi:hypothetical protein
VLVLGRAKTGKGDLRSLLPALLERARGKGGGGADFLQITAGDGAAAASAFDWAAGAVSEAVEAST